MTVRLDLDDAAIAGLAASGDMVQLVDDVAAAVVSATKTSSTIRTGHFMRSVKASNAVVSQATAVATVGSDDAGAVAIEFGSINNPPMAPFRKGVRAVGLRLVESR